MFTGLIEEIGAVRSVRNAAGGIYLTISSNIVIEGIKQGDSISIDGACQTVTEFAADSFTVFASKVTCEITTLGQFAAGRKINLERAMRADGRFGGHIVQGHVDGKGKIKSIKKEENGIAIEILSAKDTIQYIVAKGSVAVDGISLTVVGLIEGGFTIYIIPETIKNTTLPGKAAGTEVNLETDIFAKYVKKMIDNNEEKSEKQRIENDIKIKRTLFEKGYI